MISKGYDDGSVDSSSIARCKNNKWVDLPTSSGDGGNQWGVLVNFHCMVVYRKQS